MKLSIPVIEAFEKKLSDIFPGIKKDEPLSEYTTMGVGGRAAYFATAVTTGQIVEAVRACRKFDMPFRVLGCGSNVIISDAGFPGVILRNRAGSWRILDENPRSKMQENTAARFATFGEDYYTTDGLVYSDAHAPGVLVRVDSGARLAPLLKEMLREGITGLQWFAGIPATTGGATFMNMHGGAVFFGDFIARARLLCGAEIKKVDRDYFQFDYDWSILHETGQIVLSVDLILRRGDVERARKHAREWARRKAIQPQKSAGCIFQNLAEADQKRLGLPTPSIGYLLDRVLKLKGKQIGGAIISPYHAAFIENTGDARASDVFRLVQYIREKAKAELGVELKLEIEFIGEFEPSIIQSRSKRLPQAF
jgi:UDP-N-acetylmuramate dehydrogenase